MAEKSANNQQTALDPMFFIPEGVQELVYDDSRTANADEAAVEEVSEDYFVTDDADTNYSDAPDTPDILEVVSQTVRTTAAGNQVVDLVVEVEDIPGAIRYEFRVTKVD